MLHGGHRGVCWWCCSRSGSLLDVGFNGFLHALPHVGGHDQSSSSQHRREVTAILCWCVVGCCQQRAFTRVRPRKAAPEGTNESPPRQSHIPTTSVNPLISKPQLEGPRTAINHKQQLEGDRHHSQSVSQSVNQSNNQSIYRSCAHFVHKVSQSVGQSISQTINVSIGRARTLFIKIVVALSPASFLAFRSAPDLTSRMMVCTSTNSTATDDERQTATGTGSARSESLLAQRKMR